MTILTTIPNGASLKDIRDTLNSALARILALEAILAGSGGTVTPTPTPTPALTPALTRSAANSAARPGQGIGTFINVEPSATLTLVNDAGGAVQLNGHELSLGSGPVPQAAATINGTVRKTPAGGTATDYPFSVQVGRASHVTDNFSDTSGTAVTSRATATGGKTWAATSGFSPTTNGSGRLVMPTAGGHISFTRDQANAIVSAIIRPQYAGGSNPVSMPELRFRMSDDTHYWYVRPDPRSNTVQIVFYDGGTEYEQACVGWTIPTGQDVHVGLRLVDEFITLLLNGQEQFTIRNAFLATNMRVGIGHAYNGAGSGLGQVAEFNVAPIMGTSIAWPKFTEAENASPVLVLGSSSEWDRSDVNNPNVTYDPKRSRWIMDYSGYSDANGNNQVQHAGQAYATTLAGPWTKDAANPVILADSADGMYAFNGGVIYSPARGLFIRVYCASNPSGLRVATSPSGDAGTWTRTGYAIINTEYATWNAGGSFDSALRRLKDGRIELWYCGQPTGSGTAFRNRKYGRMFSSDEGVTWQADPANPVYTPGAIETAFVGACFYQDLGEPFPYTPSATGGEQNHTLVVFDGVKMRSMQTPGTSNETQSGGYTSNRHLHYAVTLDNGKTWRRFLDAMQPFGGGYASKQTFDSCIQEDGATLRLFHGGGNVNGAALNLNIQIGMATAPTPTSLVA